MGWWVCVDFLNFIFKVFFSVIRGKKILLLRLCDSLGKNIAMTTFTLLKFYFYLSSFIT